MVQVKVDENFLWFAQMDPSDTQLELYFKLKHSHD